ncbi:MAG: 3-deoxy-D-manno-octulosonic acid transferase, partial [Chitinophagales bacterium]
CASLGEFEQGRPIIESIRNAHPLTKIVVTFFSPSGYEVKKNYEVADKVLYLPSDSRKNARAFINAIHPNLVIWVKYEYWYFYLQELKNHNIPVLLVSAIFNPDQPFFKWHGALHRSMLHCFSQIFVQNQDSLGLLGRVGLEGKAILAGDTRFDRVIQIAESFEPLPSIEAFCGCSPVIVAGSTWEEDEEELDHYANTHPQIKFIIAPHEVDPVHLKEMENLFHRTIRFSLLAENQATWRKEGGQGKTSLPNVLLIDNIGLLSRLYKYATIAYVGGGFGEDGVHNVLEAAVYGRPVVYGPVIEKYAEALELVDRGGGIVIDSAVEAETVFSRLLADPDEYRISCEASKKYVYAMKGATEKILEFIQANRLLTN